MYSEVKRALTDFVTTVDAEEQVIARELSSLSTLTSLGIHQKSRLWEALFAVIPLLYHPNVWIRSGPLSSFLKRTSAKETLYRLVKLRNSSC